MKIYLYFFFFLFILSSFSQRTIDSKDVAIFIKANVSLTPTPKVILSWQKNELAIAYGVRMKKCSDANFPNELLAQLDSNTTSYTINNLTDGECYEFEVRAASIGKIQGQIGQFIAFGYIAVGINFIEPSKGACLLVVDSTMNTPLENEINTLIQDMNNEGWGVMKILAPRAETFNKSAVAETKSLIKNAKQSNPSINTVLLLGRVPVPYSGNINPDGHGDHLGAWPADVYYGFMNDLFFTDQTVNSVVSGAREETKNIPGDGKFDVSTFSNYTSDLAVGRIDMYNMPAFHDKSWANGELELLRRYLNKDHKFRTTVNYAEKRGLIDESPSFVGNNIIECFASTGWRNFGNLFGYENVNKMDWFTNLKDNSYLMAYGTGPGSYTSAGDIGNSTDFVSTPIKSVFTMLFGSYFGDWDNKNNFLRAPLAADGMALTCAWAARPHWFLHQMAVGYSIGYSSRITQNNLNTYLPNIFYITGYPDGVIYAIGMKGVHVALLGDPTLKLYPAPTNLYPARNLTINVLPNGDVKLNWEEPIIGNNYYYNVYRATKADGPFVRINDKPINTLSTIDTFKFKGTLYYAVMSTKPESTLNGIIYKNSTASVSSIVTDVEEKRNPLELSLSPNPASENVNIAIHNSVSNTIKIEVFDIKGELVTTLYDSYSNSSDYTFSWDLTNSNKVKLDNGVYFVKFNFNGNQIVEKLIINK